MEEQSIYKSWDEVDEALGKIADIDNEIKQLQTETRIKCRQLKATAEVAIEQKKDKINIIMKEAQKYADAHQEDFGKLKTRNLNNGRLGYKLKSSLTMPQDDQKEIIQALIEKGHTDCVDYTSRINLTKLRRLPEEALEEIGASVSTGNAFFVSTRNLKVPETGSYDGQTKKSV